MKTYIFVRSDIFKIFIWLLFSLTAVASEREFYTDKKDPPFVTTGGMAAGKGSLINISPPFVEETASSLASLNLENDTDYNLLRQKIREIVCKEENLLPNVSVEALFLGPLGENGDILEQLLLEAVRDHIYWRRNVHPDDPIHITERIKRSQNYLDTQDKLRRHLRLLLSALKKSTPFFSLRYQGHMNWENTLPGLLGYIAAMLYNPNNVAYEASPATSILEEQVANDLCKMIGYSVAFPFGEKLVQEKPHSWGHLTCDGSVANIEALWVARNLKFYPLAVKWALQQEKILKPAENLKVRLLKNDEDVILKELDTWSALNIDSDQTLQLPEKIFKLLSDGNLDSQSLTLDEVYRILAKYSLQNVGFHKFYKKLQKDTKEKIRSPVILAAGTKHYSISKAASLLGLGQENLCNIQVDEDARMDLEDFNDKLEFYSVKRHPIIAVIAVMGTTEEGAVDPLHEIIEKREKSRKEGIDFFLHADAAWGGYQMSLLRGGKKNHSNEVPVIPLNSYVEKQFEAIKEADSVTIDPHKTGYIQYSAGSLCYRNEAMKNMVNFTAPYILAHEEKEPNIGTFGVEGSKPGATAAAVYLSHRVIPLTKYGYGRIVGQALYSTKKFYTRLLAMKDPLFLVVPLARAPAAKNNVRGTGQKRLQTYKDIIDFTKKDIFSSQNIEAKKFLKEIGPDLNILVYAFNFRTKEGKINTDLSKANIFNQEIYKLLSPQYNNGVAKYNYNLIVSTSSFSTEEYGSKLLKDFTKRLKIEMPNEQFSLNVIRSVVMDPWLTETEEGSFLNTIENELRAAARKAALSMH